VKILKLFEYEAKKIFGKYGIPVPRGELATSPKEACRICSELKFPVAIKAQVLVSGRGKAGGILFALWFVGMAADLLPEAIVEVIGYFSLSTYFPDFMRGVIDTRGIIYYLSITVLFLFLAIRSLESSRWS
jgi:hypothetical protein